MELTLEQALQKGIEAHKAGKVQEADKYYTAILKANPKHPDANHNMGALAVGVGKVEAALPFFKTALEVNQTIGQYWLSYINALIKLDRMDEAKSVLNQAKSNGAKGDGFDKFDGRLNGIEKQTNKVMMVQEPSEDQLQPLIDLYTQGQYQDAQTRAIQLLKQFPNSAILLNLIGATNEKLSKLDKALEAYKKAISIQPNYFEAYNNMGVTLQEQGKLDEALEAYNKALIIKPDYAKAYNNTTELLKIHSPTSKKSHILFQIDSNIKKLSSKLLNAKTNTEVIKSILEGLNYIKQDDFKYKTSLSQIFKRNSVDLNCIRHLKIFNTKDIIPEFCFGCFKVQVEVATIIDLVKVTSIFYKFDFEEDLTKKTTIELRPKIPGYYKGLIYCNGLDQAEEVKTLLDISLKEIFGGKTTSNIKRGCSEYPLKFPKYGKITKKPKGMMNFPTEWRPFEEKFDQNELIKPNENSQPSLPEFCLSDFYIIQKWIDYAKGIGDQSIEIFNDMPIVFKDINEIAKIRATF